jgi:PhzF family phenazine biosynthesis protein
MFDKVLRLAAFAQEPGGGNPAGVVLGTALPSPAEMQRVAAEVGDSETAFLADQGGGAYLVRYFSPQREVPFCGHATIAAGVALGVSVEGYRFETLAGAVAVRVRLVEGRPRATLTSVEPRIEPLSASVAAALLDAFGWSAAELDPALPLMLAYAGAWHPIVAVRSRPLLAALRYDFERLRALMLEHTLTTVQVVYRQDPSTFWARNPFPVGGVVEDPATGAAAAALGGYLRALRRIEAPADLTVLQGHDLGRPSVLSVHVPSSGGIEVSGTAVRL